MEGLERALHVGLEDYAELRNLFRLHLLVEFLERQALRLALVGLAALEFALRHKLARLALRRKRRELLAGLRDALKAEHLDRHAWARFVDVASLVVYHRADFAPRGAGVYDVAAAQRSVLNDDGGDGALALVEVRLDDGAGGRGLRVCFQLLHFGDEQKHFEQVVHMEPLLCGYVDHNRVAAPFLGDEAVVGELLAHALRLRLGFVYLVDRDDYRHARGLRVVERLDGLRLDAVVSGDDEYGDVRNLSAARAHRGEGLVARRVEEDERVAVVFDARGSDVLRDAAGLFLRDVGFSDVVEERRLAVVDVAHDGDDRRARLKLSVAALLALFLFILGFEFFVGYRLLSLRALLRRGLFRGLRFGRLRRGFGGRRFFLRRSGGRSLRGEDEILFEGLAEYLENLFVGARRRGEHEPLHHQRLDRASGLFARERRYVGD